MYGITSPIFLAIDIERLHQKPTSMGGHYDVGQICLNGHVINSHARQYSDMNSDYCPTCGEKTITQCPSCNTPIRGMFEVPGVIDMVSRYHAPAFCYKCGKPYP